MKYKDGNIAPRPYGQRVLTQWKQRGNLFATEDKRTVFVIPRIKTFPPGKTVSVLYTTRAMYHANRIKVSEEPVALVATSAEKQECSEWIAQQKDIYETIEIVPHITVAPSTTGKPQHRPNCDISNEELYQSIQAGHTIRDLADQYGCTYHNLYNRYRRYSDRISGNVVPRKNTYYDIDNEELVYQIENLGKSFNEVAKEYGSSYQVIYARYKRYGNNTKTG